MRPLLELIAETIRFLIVLILCLCFVQLGMSCAQHAHADHQPKYKIAIIDTGYNRYSQGEKLKLCDGGHFDYQYGFPSIGYVNNHGTTIGNIIAESLKDVDYCAIIIQWGKEDGVYPYKNYLSALARAKQEGATFINLSLAGVKSDMKEKRLLTSLTDGGAIVFVASGNEHKDLDFECDVFPACYRMHNVKVVGSFDFKGANYGSVVDYAESGYAGKDYGTSFAVPRALANYILKLESK